MGWDPVTVDPCRKALDCVVDCIEIVFSSVVCTPASIFSFHFHVSAVYMHADLFLHV